ncbi:MAG: hypothetical protein PHW60_15765 [Kiritimatiellae bacterium]|nr:hypothetical protein [Kiritimatiellia bacterium]
MTDCILGTRTLPMDDAWDVIVAGGGPSGCAAAMAAAGGRNAHKVDTERLRQKLKAYGAFLPDAPASGKA